MSNFVCAKCCTEYQERLGYCTSCGSFGFIVHSTRRHADTMWRDRPEIENASELIKRSNSYITSKSYPEIKFGAKGLVCVYGYPGAGKSTWLLKLLDGMEGQTLYLSLEEALSDTLISKLKWLEISSKKFKVGYIRSLNELDSMLSSENYTAVGIDSLSVSTLNLDDLRRIANAYDLIVFFTLQVNKSGEPQGLMSNIHGADLVISVNSGQWLIEKSRYSGLLQGGVLL